MPEIAAHVADAPTQTVVHEAGEKKQTGRLVLGYVGRILLCGVFGLPLLFLIISSFKPDLQIFADLTSIKAFLPVGDLTLDNYRGVFDRVPFATFMNHGRPDRGHGGSGQHLGVPEPLSARRGLGAAAVTVARRRPRRRALPRG